MKKNIKGLYLVEAIMFILVIIFNIFKVYYAYNVILFLTALFCYFKFGYVKDNAYEKSNVIRVVIATVLAFTLIIYLLGVFTGFYKTNYIPIMGFILSFGLKAIAIISTEVIRYIVAKNSVKNVKPLVLLTIVLIILDIITQTNITYYTDRWRIFVLISALILPVIAREMLCSYTAYKCSATPNIVYRLLTEVIFHFLPITPNLGDYLYAVVKILMPAAIFFFSNKVYKYHEKSGLYVKKASRWIILAPLLIFALVMIYLVSGLFRYKMIAIGSGSMEPEYYKGDAVIFEKATADKLKVGEILVFKEGHTIITHRIVSISKGLNDKYDIVTKGDNNETVDFYIVQKEDVVGVVKYSVKFVGYPTLWVNELLD